ncbi:hypothetical protein QP185_21195 [Sphingomonas aerolata]|uniref:hypothetical protein n=1 Tax=Sphingomonas aerolata TaxID=185951 RepID=UPI002FDFB53C
MDSLLQLIEQDGYAQVLIELEPGTATTIASAADAQVALAGFFIDPAVAGERPRGAVLTSELGPGLAANAPIKLQMSTSADQLEPTPAVRVFPTLRLALGYVDRVGIEALAGSPGIGRIVRAETPSLIRPVQIRLAADAQPATSWGSSGSVRPPCGRRGSAVPGCWSVMSIPGLTAAIPHWRTRSRPSPSSI